MGRSKVNQTETFDSASSFANDASEIVDLIENRLIANGGGRAKLRDLIGKLVREAIDYIVDGPRLRRWSFEELPPDEKAFVGRRIESLIKFELHLPDGNRFDAMIDGYEVEIKCTTSASRSWMFSPKSEEIPHLMIAIDEGRAVFSMGLIVPSATSYGGGKNRDKKKQLSALGARAIQWIFESESYPANFLASLPKPLKKKIELAPSGQARVLELLRGCPNQLIPRHAIACVANQLDPMKRIRRNGGAREPLDAENLRILNGVWASARREALKAGFPNMTKDHVLVLSKRG